MSECFLVQEDKYETKPELQAEKYDISITLKRENTLQHK